MSSEILRKFTFQLVKIKSVVWLITITRKLIFTFQLVKIKRGDKIKLVKLHIIAVQFVDDMNFILFEYTIFIVSCQTSVIISLWSCCRRYGFFALSAIDSYMKLSVKSS